MAFLITAKVIGSPSVFAASGIGVLHLDGDAARARRAGGAAWRHDDRRIVTLDDRRTGDGALLHRRARQQAGFDRRFAASKGHQALAALAGESAGVEAEAIEVKPACRGANRRET